MKIQNQVCTIEQAIKLRNLGVAQIALFYYCYPEIMPASWLDGTTLLNDTYAAFTGAELVLCCNGLGGIEYSLRGNKYGDNKGKYYRQISEGADFDSRFKYYGTFTEAMADKLIYMLENDFSILADVNKLLAES